MKIGWTDFLCSVKLDVLPPSYSLALSVFCMRSHQKLLRTAPQWLIAEARNVLSRSSQVLVLKISGHVNQRDGRTEHKAGKVVRSLTSQFDVTTVVRWGERKHKAWEGQHRPPCLPYVTAVEGNLFFSDIISYFEPTIPTQILEKKISRFKLVLSCGTKEEKNMKTPTQIL